MSEDNDNKLNLEVPEHLEYSDEHVWVDASVEPAMVGITLALTLLRRRPGAPEQEDAHASH